MDKEIIYGTYTLKDIMHGEDELTEQWASRLDYDGKVQDIFKTLPKSMQKYKPYCQIRISNLGVPHWCIDADIYNFYLDNGVFPEKCKLERQNFEPTLLDAKDYSAVYVSVEVPPTVLSGLARWNELKGQSFTTEQFLQMAIAEFCNKDDRRRFLFSERLYEKTKAVEKVFKDRDLL